MYSKIFQKLKIFKLLLNLVRYALGEHTASSKRASLVQW